MYLKIIFVLFYFKNTCTGGINFFQKYKKSTSNIRIFIIPFCFFFDMLWQLLLTMKFYVSLQTKTLVKPDDQLDLNDQVNKLCTVHYLINLFNDENIIFFNLSNISVLHRLLKVMVYLIYKA